jgi:hypothetical protein
VKNKYNIPIILDNINARKGNFIDYLTDPYNNIIFKRRCISNEDRFIRYGIQLILLIHEK